MTVLFDLLLTPFKSLHPLWGMSWISALAGVLMILVFKWTSNQQAISELRRKMGSRALGMLLYLESPPTVVKLGFSLIMDNFIYLWHILRPMLVIALPFVLTAAQLDARYGFLPPSETQPSTAVIRWKSAPSGAPEAETGTIISPVVTIADSLEQSFSFTSSQGVFSTADGTVKAGTDSQTGSVVVRGAEQNSIMRDLFRPWNGAAAEGVKSVQIHLQPAHYNVLGGRWSWFAVFLVFSSLWAIAGAVVFRVKV
ncbi:hypothetical protein CSA37_08920 [Candidatus Fermentibacteria bacterium]|nr:MAG: hypothetical protein CSA37_08920 [Candidatus Fermentibacteria bacterium]